jgi:hypothetical protein
MLGKWCIGRIYQVRGGPDSLRWFWSMNANGPMTRSDRVETLEDAKAHPLTDNHCCEGYAILVRSRRKRGDVRAGARLSALRSHLEGSDPWVKKRQPLDFGLHFLGC